MKAVWTIAKREWMSYFTTWSGYLIVAGMLLMQGLLFNTLVLQGGKDQKSSDVVYGFFYFTVFTTIVAGVLVAARTFAEEKATGTIVLLETAPVREWQVVAGKFAGAFGCVLVLVAMSVYLPLLVGVNGRVDGGQLVAGYLGTTLLAAVGVAGGVFASSLTRSQVLAAILAAMMLAVLFLAWIISRKVDGNLGAFFGFLDLWDQHFRTFAKGTIKWASVAYYVAITYFFLLATTVVISSRRWRG
jgi:ABC-2 type transport system permease protein